MATEVSNLGGEEETRRELPPGFISHKALKSNVIRVVDLSIFDAPDVTRTWKASGKGTFRGHGVDVSALITQYSLLSSFTKWIAAGDGHGDQDELDKFRCRPTMVFVSDSSSTCRVMNQWSDRASTSVSPNLSSQQFNCFNVSIRRSLNIDCLASSVGEPKPSLRFSTSGVFYNHKSWATRLNIALEAAAPLIRSLLHKYSAVRYADLKPSNILLDSQMEPNISDFGWSKLQHVNLSHHPIIKMLPSASKWLGDIFTSCARLITSNRIFGMAETGWISPKPKYDTPNSGPLCEYIIRKLFAIIRKLTVNDSKQHSTWYLSSDPDSSRSAHGEMRVNTKTSASWIVATGAPHHATGDRNLLSGFTMEHDDQFVHAVNRVPMKVLARGAVITDALVLPDVWYVPGLTENLVSVRQLAELDHSISFGRGECCIESARDAKIVGKGRLQKGHYVLDYLKVPLAI